MDKEQRVNELIREYHDTFDKYFPIAMEDPLSDDEIIKAIETCLKTGQQYVEPDYEFIPNVVY